MTQVAIPPGFELVAFSWDQLSTFTIEARRFAMAELAVRHRYLGSMAATKEKERLPIDEDAERWDGLS